MALIRWPRSVALLVLIVDLLAIVGHAYIPAQPTNDSTLIATGLNESDTSMLSLYWFPNGSLQEQVSYQLAGMESTGINVAPILHFSEDDLTDDTTATPWIALISCDTNTTGSTNHTDIFTRAKDRGAIAALLYSQWSSACIINPQYANPAIFNQIMDIFATKTLSNARLVDNEFTTINQTLYRDFNASLLNASATIVNEFANTTQVPDPSYLFATLIAANASMPNMSTTPSSGSTSDSSDSGGSNNNTNLAMIVLYVITGAVSILFCVVILSGAIRAIRHPERYGPRPPDPTMGDASGQSRARGIGRAILDTFPTTKFSRTGAPTVAQPKPADVEDGTMEMTPVAENGASSMEASRPVSEIPQPTAEGSSESETVHEHEAIGLAIPRPRRTEAISEASDSTPISPAGGSNRHDSVVPDAIGRETCPICIVDFEEGDDLRILPCEGHHVFHQSCVDPWLLELSSSCPLCRQDFHALENIIAGNPTPNPDAQSPESPSHASRFSRYLRFARARRGRHSHHEAPRRRRRAWGDRDDIDEDPTNPPMPLAPDQQ